MAWSKPWSDSTGNDIINQYTYANIYTKGQIDQLLEQGNWKDSVENFGDLQNLYPEAKKGWIATVNSEKVIYYFDGIEWKGVFGKLTDENHDVGSHVIEGEETIAYRIKRNEKDNVPYTLLEVVSPNLGEGYDSEATLTLMREHDGVSNGIEFLDLYNNGYDDSRQMGIRVQSRGSGQLRDFVFEFNDGVNGIKKALSIKPEYLESSNNIVMKRDGNKIIFFRDDLDNNFAQVGYLTGRLNLSNLQSEASIEIFDNGYIQVYSPTSGVSMYLDGDLSVNDLPVSLIDSGESRPTTNKVGYCYFDTNLKKPIWWSGTEWVDANGTTV